MTKLLTVLIVTFFAFSFLGGCKKEPPKAPPKPAKVEKAEVKEQVQEAPKPEEQGYVYESKGRRDPFVPLIEVKKGKEKKLRGTGLESYDIADFKLIATAWDKNQYYALLLAPDKKAYTVRVGTTLGLHMGKVKKISQDRVTIQETAKNYKGELKPREIILKLRKEEGE
ncbi:MAG: pilus assembly protein PilP [Nitrospirae bacterium]|nr:pilus assembly protein PilP [Nitrospirota bacterium]